MRKFRVNYIETVPQELIWDDKYDLRKRLEENAKHELARQMVDDGSIFKMEMIEPQGESNVAYYGGSRIEITSELYLMDVNDLAVIDTLKRIHERISNLDADLVKMIDSELYKLKMDLDYIQNRK